MSRIKRTPDGKHYISIAKRKPKETAMSKEAEEIFGMFDGLSEIAERRGRMRFLEKQNLDAESTCGSCHNWMKTSMCKREAHHKVSCGEHKCDEYVQDVFYKNLVEKNTKELNDLRK